MLSLRLPIPSESVLASVMPRPPRFLNARNQTHLFCSPTLSELKALQSSTPQATAADVVTREQEEQELNDGTAPPEEELPEGLRRELMPKHVAVIMDGNGRWARQRGLPPGAGHQAGVESLKALVELCRRWEIRVLTVFAFSYDNWIRPKVSEVNCLIKSSCLTFVEIIEFGN